MLHRIWIIAQRAKSFYTVVVLKTYVKPFQILFEFTFSLNIIQQYISGVQSWLQAKRIALTQQKGGKQTTDIFITKYAILVWNLN